MSIKITENFQRPIAQNKLKPWPDWNVPDNLDMMVFYGFLERHHVNDGWDYTPGHNRPTDEVVIQVLPDKADDLVWAWDHLSDGENFEGTLEEFASKFMNLARLYTEALTLRETEIGETRKIYDYGDADDFVRDTNMEYIIRWAEYAAAPEWDQALDKCRKGGLDSMLEAYRAGVPVEDILAV